MAPVRKEQTLTQEHIKWVYMYAYLERQTLTSYTRFLFTVQ